MVNCSTFLIIINFKEGLTMEINITQFYNNIEFVSDDKKQHSVTVNIDYTVNFRTFQSPDTVTLTL